MSYTPPARDAVDFHFDGASYTPPDRDAVDFHFGAVQDNAGLASCATPLGAPSVLAESVIKARSAAPSLLGAPSVLAAGAITGLVSAASPLGAPSAQATPVWLAGVELPGPLGIPEILATPIWTARVSVATPLGAPSAAATVHRYELRGKVRAEGGALLVRRVRAYRRDSGAMEAEGDSTGGKVRLDVGLTQREYYTIPIDLDEAAIDFNPACANRIESVLADDLAWEAL